MSFVVAVYGSAFLQSDSPEYQLAYEVGYALAQAGYAVMTGGYDGVMGAASHGASDAGGHVIGATVKNGKGSTRERVVNRWVKEEIVCETMRTRLHYLVEKAHAYVALGGGIGTLQEITEAWQLMRVEELTARPLIAYGPFWRPILQPLIEARHYVPEAHARFLQFADTPQAIVQLVKDGVTGVR